MPDKEGESLGADDGRDDKEGESLGCDEGFVGERMKDVSTNIEQCIRDKVLNTNKYSLDQKYWEMNSELTRAVLTSMASRLDAM